MGLLPARLDPRVRIVPIGREWDEVCEWIGDAVEDEFGFAVERGERLPSPDQKYAKAYWRALEDDLDHGRTIVIGVTDDRVKRILSERSVGTSTLSQYLGSGSLISTYPYREYDGDFPGEPAAWYRRCVLVAIGRNLGMDHERQAGEDEESTTAALTCAMELDHVDPGDTRALPGEYCEGCRAFYDSTKPARLRRYPPDERSPLGLRRRLAFAWKLFLVGVIEAVYRVLNVPGKITRALSSVPSVVRSLPGRVARRAPRSPREYPKWFHTLHRSIAFWLRLGRYGLAMVAWVVVLSWGHDTIIGGELSDTAARAVGFGSLVLGILSVWALPAIVYGFYAGLRGKDPEEVLD